MEDDRMPTLFEILNRFSKPPVDLWSFYVFLREQYGGVEYLEFWLDCAAHTALCKELAKAILKVKRQTQESDSSAFPRAVTAPQRLSNHSLFTKGYADHPDSPSSSVLFNILQEDANDALSDHSPPDVLPNNRHSQISADERFDTLGSADPTKRNSTLSAERLRRKRDTVSRLSEILDNMQMPEYPTATATSPTREPRAAEHQFRGHYRDASDVSDMNVADRARPLSQHFPDGGVTDLSFVDSPLLAPAESPRHPPPSAPAPLAPHPADPLSEAGNTTDNSQDTTQSNLLAVNLKRRAVRDSASRIIYTYLVPKSAKAIELPSDGTGWSMADEIRQASALPGGTDHPKLFEPATIYVFDALEREALPAFLMYRALSNVQPVSAALRLATGLLALFGAFWLAFVFVLLDWQPRAQRCWVVLPFAVGWYLVITALYHIDPLLALTSVGERDGGGLARVQESFVRKMLMKRSLFVVAATVLLTAAFSVLFIFVPGHRL